MEIPMKRILTVAIAATALAAISGAAQADKICQWTGSDWACGDGNVFPEHYSQAAGPNMLITPVPTVIPESYPPPYNRPRN
jgi:hypothetical protein